MKKVTDNNRVAADALARSAALDATRSFLVQAPAGSGKTELLIQRYLSLLARVEEPESVVAITFTRKAAAEMRHRVVAAMEQAAAAEPVAKLHEKITRELAAAVLARNVERHWDLRHMPSRLRIQTIDSLCAAIAHGAPMASGFGGPLQVLDAPEDLYAAAAHATVLLLSGGSAAHSAAVATVLRHLDNQVSKLETLIVDMLKRRDQWLRHLPAGGDPAALRRQLDATSESIVVSCLEQLHAAVPAGAVRELVELAAFAARQECNAGRPMANLLGLTELPGVSLADREAWRGLADLLLNFGKDWRKPGGINKSIGFASGMPERARLQNLVADLSQGDELLDALQQLLALPPDNVDDRQWSIIASLFCLLPFAVAELRRLFAVHGKVDFSEIAHAASRALGDPEAPTDLALTLGHRIEHLLVDEYQDTSVTQQELLEKLVASWDDGEGRTVFLVGDPMQSIYRFRQAEVGGFIAAAQEKKIGGIKLNLLKLTANFRSRQGIVEWANTAFPKVFPAHSDVGKAAVPFTPADWVQPAGSGVAVQVHPLIASNQTNSDMLREDEADCILGLIEAARARDPNGKIAVLVRARAHLSALVPKLRAKAAEDPLYRFRSVEIDSLSDRQVIFDLLSLTRALLHLGDRIAWLSVLRAPWCGLALQDLHTLSAAGQHSCLWETIDWAVCVRVPEGLGSDAMPRLGRLHQAFAPALANLGRRSVAMVVRGLWLSLGGPACCNAAELEDANEFFDLLGEVENAGDLPDAGRLTERLASLFAHPDPQAGDSLQLMTIHKAKGLEFDTVVVAGLGRRPRREDVRLLLWVERASAAGTPELLLAPIKEVGADRDGLYLYVDCIERERGEQEAKRLLYVAATRAKAELHLVGHTVLRQSGELGCEQGSLLQHLWPAVEPDFQRALQEQSAKGVEVAAQAEVATAKFRRLPASWAVPPSPSPLPRQPAPAPLDLEVSFDWAGETARHIGTVTHALLHKIARQGVESWDKQVVEKHRETIRVALRQQGVPVAELERAADRVETALCQTLADPRGQWILRRHTHDTSEQALTAVIDGRPRNFRIDRSFVDEAGVRWIIDFKTGEREGGDRGQFADLEVVRYRLQLETYAAVMAKLDPRPARLGLYFPLLADWREWPAPGLE